MEVTDSQSPPGDRYVPVWVKASAVLLGTFGVARLAFASGGGMTSLLAVALFGGWVVLPYVFITILWRRKPVTEGHRLALELGTIATGAMGLPAYIPSPTASSTGSVVFLFAPLWQLIVVAVLWIAGKVWRRANL